MAEFFTPDSLADIKKTSEKFRKLEFLPLTHTEAEEAEKLFQYFWETFPEERNPCDIDTFEKACFLQFMGFQDLHLMQRARTQGLPFAYRTTSQALKTEGGK